LLQKGRAIYQNRCAQCHGKAGEGVAKRHEKPLAGDAPIDDPYQMFDKLYGQTKNRELLASVLDDLAADFRRIEQQIGVEDRRVLQDHLAMVREVEKELQTELEQKKSQTVTHAVLKLVGCHFVARARQCVGLISRLLDFVTPTC
jgi:hypothetical protein